jgi:TDG/mug DNA glycosylase family protein
MAVRRSPTKAELEAARGREIPHVLAPGLVLVFVGINPGLWSGATGHHFARPGNRFWPALHASGFTDRRLAPHEDVLLPRYGLGVTNLVGRTTARANELSTQEIRAGGDALAERLGPFGPRAVAIVGLGAAGIAFDLGKVGVGPTGVEVAGAALWALPNPSGLNAHYQLDDLARAFAELRLALGLPDQRA